MCGATSEDPRVQTAVKQVVKLAGTVEPGTPFEHNFFLPCLIVCPIFPPFPEPPTKSSSTSLGRCGSPTRAPPCPPTPKGVLLSRQKYLDPARSRVYSRSRPAVAWRWEGRPTGDVGGLCSGENRDYEN